MELAPLPEHSLTSDRHWRRLFGNYSHVITPLRTLGLTTDVETCGGEYTITADLSDGSYLSIAADHSLPADPADVTGWTVIRAHDDQPARAVVYDSTEDGNDAEYGNDIAPMLGRIVHWMLAGPRTISAGVPDRVGALLASLAPGPITPTAPASFAVTRATAGALERLATRGKLPDLVNVVPEARGVVVTIEPKDRAAWRTWMILIAADDAYVTNRGNYSTANGRWSGTPVHLIGLGAPQINGVGLRTQQAARQAGGAHA